MIKVENHSQGFFKNSDDESREYLYHHMHHFLEKGVIVHELHHCKMYSKPNMEGEQYNIGHLKIDSDIFHYVLSDKDLNDNELFDHNGNKFLISKKISDNIMYNIIN